MIRAKLRAVKIKTGVLMILLFSLTSCFQQGPPNTAPQKPNFVSLDPQNWLILYSAEMPRQPSADPDGAWSFEFPNLQGGGHVNYVQTPFNETTALHNVHITFIVQSDSPKYHVMDGKDFPPATVHIFLEQQSDDLVAANGRFWADPSNYNLGSDDNNAIAITVPLTPDCWTNVYGTSDSQSFYDSLKNVGWIGLTFGGQDFWGHGVAMVAGHSKFVLQRFYVD